LSPHGLGQLTARPGSPREQAQAQGPSPLLWVAWQRLLPP
jgi:hypothetical protein